MAEQSNLERLKELDAEREKLVDASVSEAIAQINNLISELSALGQTFELVKVDGRKTRKASSTSREKSQCTICKFDTIPQHDGRTHRDQRENKRPYTDKELAKHGLVKA